MKQYGLIGFPLTHSFSKEYFTKKFEVENIRGVSYELFPIKRLDELKNVLSDHPNLCGLNVTIPFKEHIVPFLYNADQLLLPACNCIKIVNDQLIGYNTDIIGFEKSFSRKLPITKSKALILGTGGASIAVQYVLKKLGIDFLTVSRSRKGNVQYEDLSKGLLNDYNIIINTTPLGTFPNINECPAIPYEYITKNHYCYDLIYNPEKSLFLQKAENHGATVQNGYEMLVIQAEGSWKIWNE